MKRRLFVCPFVSSLAPDARSFVMAINFLALFSLRLLDMFLLESVIPRYVVLYSFFRTPAAICRTMFGSFISSFDAQTVLHFALSRLISYFADPCPTRMQPRLDVVPDYGVQ